MCPVVMYNMTGATLNTLQINTETVTIIKYSRFNSYWEIYILIILCIAVCFGIE